MQGQSGGEGSYRRALALGAAIAVAMYGLVLIYGETSLRAAADATRSDVRLVELVRGAEAADAPLETTVRAESAVELGRETRSEVPEAGAPEAVFFTPAPSALTPEPAAVLEKLNAVEVSRNPAETYASVSDLLISSAPNPRPLRPIDDRPVEVLAAIGGGARGGGIRMGGGDCGPVRPSMLRRAPLNRIVVRGATF